MNSVRIGPRALLIAAGIVVAILLTAFGLERTATSTPTSLPGPASVDGSGSTGSTPRSGLPTIAESALPVQARSVLALIERGGPYPYRQDGTVFSNFEGLLPSRPRGYYHEYTVPTPGSEDRGARRLIVGHAGDVYYTDDHYNSFRQVLR